MLPVVAAHPNCGESGDEGEGGDEDESGNEINWMRGDGNGEQPESKPGLCHSIHSK